MSLPPLATPGFLAVAVTFGIGLMIGIERERARSGDDDGHPGGIRTFTLVSLLGLLSNWLGSAMLLAGFLGVTALAVAAHVRSRSPNLGLTTEVAIPATFLLGALTTTQPAWAAGIGVIVAVLLAAKSSMHHFSRQVLTTAEVRDGLILAAAVLVVLPLLPEQAFGPADLFDLRRLWLLLVVLLAIGMLGHVCQRLLGARAGIPLAGFLAGFASSTAATASFGQKVRDGDVDPAAGAGSALLANLASLLMFIGIIGGLAPKLLVASRWSLGMAAASLLVVALSMLRRRGVADEDPQGGNAVAGDSGAFRLGHAALLALAIFAITVVAGAMNHWFGSVGALTTATVAALAEVHAAAASIAQLAAGDSISTGRATQGLVLALAASFVAKGVVAAISGSRAYAWRFCIGLGLALMLAVAGLFLPLPFL
ncbi:MAG: DUF4010 domain-containing protein [Lysobacteraceae bacterium]